MFRTPFEHRQPRPPEITFLRPDLLEMLLDITPPIERMTWGRQRHGCAMLYIMHETTQAASNGGIAQDVF